MIFIANALPINGGTTFLIRMCRELHDRNKKVTVLVIFNEVDAEMYAELSCWADVIFLEEFSFKYFSKFFKTQLGSFLPLNFSKINELLNTHKREVHVLGIFGLLLVERIIRKTKKSINYTVGIYHQNEFIFNNVRFYFSSKAQEIFSNIEPKKIIFFNETTKIAYEKFFRKKYSESKILPIGINVDREINSISGNSNSNRIISIGNLYRFKTYNKHIISIMPELLNINPSLVYEIYGVGPYENELRSLAIELSVDGSVFFKGAIAYEKMNDALNDSLVFIGSGTAIIEASLLGIPSVIGIESIQTPETYGFFGEITDLSYNEFTEDKRIFNISNVIISVINNEENWNKQSIKSRLKAQEFSIERTVDGFIEVFGKEEIRVAGKYSNILSFFSFVYCSVLHVLSVDKEFSNRRNQGTI